MENKLLEANSSLKNGDTGDRKKRREERIEERKLRKYKKEINEVKSKTPWGRYSSIIDEKGKEIKDPKFKDQMRVMMEYLKNNNPETSNVYRQEHIHSAMNYNPKKMDYIKGRS